MGFGSVGAFGGGVPVVLVQLGAGPAVLQADVGDVFCGVGLGAVEAVAFRVHAAGDLKADEVAVGKALRAIASVEGVAAEGDAFDGVLFVDHDVETDGAVVCAHGLRFFHGAGAAGGVVDNEPFRGHRVGGFEGVFRCGQPVGGEGVGHLLGHSFRVNW